jgi:hypothetical protein
LPGRRAAQDGLSRLRESFAAASLPIKIITVVALCLAVPVVAIVIDLGIIFHWAYAFVLSIYAAYRAPHRTGITVRRSGRRGDRLRGSRQ